VITKGACVAPDSWKQLAEESRLEQEKGLPL